MIVRILQYAVNILFPPQCVGCRKTATLLCPKCFSSLPIAPQPKEPFVTALFDYRYPTVKRIIWKLKYQNVRTMAEPFGEKLYDEIIGALGEDLPTSKNEVFLLVPIPLHKKRQRERGYNQSELIARTVLRYNTNNILEISCTSLSRTKATPPQAKRNKRSERIKNLHGAFEARHEVVCGKQIILIDDVTTTGATLSEARKTLLAAGARSVRAFTLAH